MIFFFLSFQLFWYYLKRKKFRLIHTVWSFKLITFIIKIKYLFGSVISVAFCPTTSLKTIQLISDVWFGNPPIKKCVLNYVFFVFRKVKKCSFSFMRNLFLIYRYKLINPFNKNTLISFKSLKHMRNYSSPLELVLFSIRVKPRM